MSISEKLTQIAKNAPLVYEAGAKDTQNKYEKVKAEGQVIRFDTNFEHQQLKLTSELNISEYQNHIYLTHYKGRNFFDPQVITLTFGKQILKKNGQLLGSGVYYGSSQIPCTHLRNKYIFLNHPPKADNNSNAGFGFYSGQPTDITNEQVDFFISQEEGEDRGDYIVKVPDNAVYMRFSIRNTHVNNGDIVLQVLDEDPRSDDAKITLTQLQSMEYEPFNGKSILFGLNTPINKAIYNWDTGEILDPEDESVIELAQPFPIQVEKGENIIACSFSITYLNSRTNSFNDLLQVYEVGNDKGKIDFWDWVQDSGKRTYYEYAFYRWNMEYIRPKYKAILTNRGHRMFTNNPSLKKVEKKYFDLSGVTTVNTAGSTSTYSEMFKNCPLLEKIEDIGMPAAGYYHTFHTCSSLETIEKLRVNKDCVFNNAFNGCTSLRDITIDGEIGQDADFHWSPLTEEVIRHIISKLSDTASGKSIVFNTQAIKNAFNTITNADGAEESESWNTLKESKPNWSIGTNDV